MLIVRGFMLRASALGIRAIEASSFVVSLFGESKIRMRGLKVCSGTRSFEGKYNKIKEFEIKMSGARLFIFFFCIFSTQIQASSESTSCERTGCERMGCETKTPAVWYALGSESYQKGDYAKACCLWQRACAVGGNATVRKNAEHNCRCAYKKLGLEAPVLPWWRNLSASCARLPLFFFQLLFLLFLYGALLFIYKGRRQRITRARSAVLFTCAVVLSGLLLLNRSLSDARVLGVVVQDQQLLYAGPDSDYPERGYLTRGQTVELCSIRGEWYKIRSSAREIGWIPRAALMSVKP
jgi:hypothetical protein